MFVAFLLNHQNSKTKKKKNFFEFSSILHFERWHEGVFVLYKFICMRNLLFTKSKNVIILIILVKIPKVLKGCAQKKQKLKKEKQNENNYPILTLKSHFKLQMKQP